MNIPVANPATRFGRRRAKLLFLLLGIAGFFSAIHLTEAKNPVFIDVARNAGLADFRNVQGAPSKQHIVETMGGGHTKIGIRWKERYAGFWSTASCHYGWCAWIAAYSALSLEDT